MTVFFLIYLGLLHPGYEINDDLKIISIASGYPGGDPAPFLVYSNVLLGFILIPLYALHTVLNWEMLLFSMINFFSLWGLLFILLLRPGPARIKVFEGTVVLAGAAYFILNITYSNVGLLACFAGICMILASARSSMLIQKAPLLWGIALILIGSLIRIEMLALLLPTTLMGLIFTARSLNLKNIVIGYLIAGLFVGAGYALDKVYVRSNPGWHTYYFYNKTRQSLHDSHRLENLHSEIHHIGWSGNDQELFARWFFPDQGIYSLDRIRYLDAHIPAVSSNLLRTAGVFFSTLMLPQPSAYFIIMAAIWLGILSRKPSIRRAFILSTIWAICLAENLFLAWAYKDPDNVLISTIICSTILGLVILPFTESNDTNLVSNSRHLAILSRSAFYGSILCVIVGMGLILRLSLQTSSINLNKQIAYQNIMDDLRNLQAEGKLSENALIISPAHGLPMEWSNPFLLEFPDIPYFDTGWITFSPPYEQVLQKFDINSLPDALYKKNNLYLMTRSNFTAFLARYYQEHENTTVAFQAIYEMPNTFNFAGYNDIHLYKVVEINE